MISSCEKASKALQLFSLGFMMAEQEAGSALFWCCTAVKW
jgi:hypothetical protein